MEHKERFKKVAKMWADAPEVRPCLTLLRLNSCWSTTDAYAFIYPYLQNPKNKAE